MPRAATPYSVITSYSVESIFLGINCVLYGFCAYTLWGQKPRSCRMLLIINTMQFLLCVAQILLHAILNFIVLTTFIPAKILPYLAHVNGYTVTITIIYNVNFAIGGFLSMWRLYVLYNSNLKICIPAFLFWIGQLCLSGITISICVTVPIVSTRFNVSNVLLWAFITMVYSCVAIPICYRLCMAQKRTHTVLSDSIFKSIAIILVECGALITVGSLAMLILYACNFAFALRSLGVATEVAVASQLLITARHAMLNRDHAASPPPTALEIDWPTDLRQVTVPQGSGKNKNNNMFSRSGGNLRDKKGWQSLGDE